MSKNNRNKQLIIDEKARLMSYAGLALHGIVLGFVVPMLFSNTEKQTENTTKVLSIERSIDDVKATQKETSNDLKALIKESAETKGDVKSIKANMDIIVSLVMRADKELMKETQQEAQKKKIKKKGLDGDVKEKGIVSDEGFIEL